MQGNFNGFVDEIKNAFSNENNVAGESIVPDEALDFTPFATVNAATLAEQELLPLDFIVDDLIVSPGLTLLCAAPKIGKSWMALNLSLAVTKGFYFLGRKVHKNGVLYLALEDSARRLNGRMQKLLCGNPAPDNLFFVTESDNLQGNLIKQLQYHVDHFPDTKLVIIDTLQKVRAINSGKDVYGADYATIGTLKSFADTNNIAILVVHHLRKMKDETDVFNQISGSIGLSGAADSMVILERKNRNDRETVMSITGRDIEAEERILTFNRDSCYWEDEGSMDELYLKEREAQYNDIGLVRAIKHLLNVAPSKTWTGTTGEFMRQAQLAGLEIEANYKTFSAQVKSLEPDLMKFDRISHITKSNGNAGIVHIFNRA